MTGTDGCLLCSCMTLLHIAHPLLQPIRHPNLKPHSLYPQANCPNIGKVQEKRRSMACQLWTCGGTLALPALRATFRLDSPVENPHTDPFQTPSKLGHPSYPNAPKFMSLKLP